MHEGYGYDGGGHAPRDPRAGPLHGGPSGMGDLPPDYQWSVHGGRVKPGPGPSHQVSPAPQGDGFRQGLSPEQCAMVEALDEAMTRKAVVRAEVAPHSTEPYRALTLNLFRRFLITPDAATDAQAFTGAVNAGVAAIALDTVPPETSFLVFTPAPINAMTLVGSFRVPRGYVAVLNHFQTWTHNWLARHYVRWRVSISRSSQLENVEAAAFSGAGEHGRIFGVAHENDAILVEAANHDENSGVIAHFLLSGWFFPVAQLDDSLVSLFLSSERGPRGRRFFSGC